MRFGRSEVRLGEKCLEPRTMQIQVRDDGLAPLSFTAHSAVHRFQRVQARRQIDIVLINLFLRIFVGADPRRTQVGMINSEFHKY